jgi:hypothetical protein
LDLSCVYEHDVQDEPAKLWDVGMSSLKELPPTIWCVCGVYATPGKTRGSVRSTTSCEQGKRSMRENWAVEDWAKRTSPAAREKRTMLGRS